MIVPPGFPVSNCIPEQPASLQPTQWIAQMQALAMAQRTPMAFPTPRNFYSGIRDDQGNLVNEYVINGPIPNGIESLIERGIFSREAVFTTDYYVDGQKMDITHPHHPMNNGPWRDTAALMTLEGLPHELKLLPPGYEEIENIHLAGVNVLEKFLNPDPIENSSGD